MITLSCVGEGSKIDCSPATGHSGVCVCVLEEHPDGIV